MVEGTKASDKAFSFAATAGLLGPRDPGVDRSGQKEAGNEKLSSMLKETSADNLHLPLK